MNKKPARLIVLFVFVLFTAALLVFFGNLKSASAMVLQASRAIAPASYVTLSGGSGRQPVGNLAVLDQSGTQDDPSAYVTFTTPGTKIYKGYRQYYLPADVLRGSVSTMTVSANFKGLAPARQTWVWSLYNWTAKSWVNIGYNLRTSPTQWKLLTFGVSNPQRFVNASTGEIRLMLRSSNPSGNAKLDYEAISFGYSYTPTPQPTRTPGGPDGPTLGGCPVFPVDNIWNTRIDTLPVNAHSAAWINSIGRSTGFHMDFGSGTWDGGPIGIPYNVVPSTLTGTKLTRSQFEYGDESDPAYYPIPANPKKEYGSDHHILLLKQGECKLYELYKVPDSPWYAGSGAIWDLNSNALRPDTWTSADAAGLPILPGLVRYDEITAGAINHAIRFTANSTAGYIWPARHLTDDPNLNVIPPMGARFRLKASFNISGYDPKMQVLLQAMKTYGIILADNGSDWYVSGSPNAGWNNDELHTLDDITGNDFEAVDESSLMVDPNSGQAHQP